MAEKRTDKEKIKGLIKAVMRNEGSPNSQKYYANKAMAIAKRRKKERKERESSNNSSKAQRVLAAKKDKVAY